MISTHRMYSDFKQPYKKSNSNHIDRWILPSRLRSGNRHNPFPNPTHTPTPPPPTKHTHTHRGGWGGTTLKTYTMFLRAVNGNLELPLISTSSISSNSISSFHLESFACPAPESPCSAGWSSSWTQHDDVFGALCWSGLSRESGGCC